MSTNLSCNDQGTGTSLDPYIKSFEDSLTKRRYTSGTIRTYRVFVRRFAMLLQKRGISPEQLTVKWAAELVSDKRVRGQHGSGQVALKFVEHLIEIGVASAPSSAGGAAEHRASQPKVECATGGPSADHVLRSIRPAG